MECGIVGSIAASSMVKVDKSIISDHVIMDCEIIRENETWRVQE